MVSHPDAPRIRTHPGTASLQPVEVAMTPEEIEAGRERWQQRYAGSHVRDRDFTTVSDM